MSTRHTDPHPDFVRFIWFWGIVILIGVGCSSCGSAPTDTGHARPNMDCESGTYVDGVCR